MLLCGRELPRIEDYELRVAQRAHEQQGVRHHGVPLRIAHRLRVLLGHVAAVVALTIPPLPRHTR